LSHLLGACQAGHKFSAKAWITSEEHGLLPLACKLADAVTQTAPLKLGWLLSLDSGHHRRLILYLNLSIPFQSFPQPVGGQSSQSLKSFSNLTTSLGGLAELG